MGLPAVSALLGHTSITTTAETYAHVISGSETAAASVIEKAYTPPEE